MLGVEFTLEALVEIGYSRDDLEGYLVNASNGDDAAPPVGVAIAGAAAVAVAVVGLASDDDLVDAAVDGIDDGDLGRLFGNTAVDGGLGLCDGGDVFLSRPTLATAAASASARVDAAVAADLSPGGISQSHESQNIRAKRSRSPTRRSTRVCQKQF